MGLHMIKVPVWYECWRVSCRYYEPKIPNSNVQTNILPLNGLKDTSGRPKYGRGNRSEYNIGCPFNFMWFTWTDLLEYRPCWCRASSWVWTWLAHLYGSFGLWLSHTSSSALHRCLEVEWSLAREVRTKTMTNNYQIPYSKQFPEQ